MSIIIWILISYIILTIWLRVADSLFGVASRRQKLLLLWAWMVIALFLFSLPYLLSVWWVQIDWFGFHSSAVIWTILGYLVLATNEEVLKFCWSYISYISEHLTRNDLILYAILIALGFAFWENIIYTIRDASGISESAALSVSRGLTWYLGHAIFTGTIGYITAKASSRKRLWIIVALIWGIVLHVIFNLFLHYGLVLGFLLYIIAGYLLLSYLFYSSDRVYLD